jgi:hypothetical protein
MSRGLTSAALTAVNGEVVSRTNAVELDFPDGMVRYCGAHADLTIDGDLYYGVGLLGGVSAVEESAELRSYGITVSLSGIPRDVVSIALTQSYQGRRATVWEVFLGSDGLPVADPTLIFRGRMDQMEISLGEEGVVRVRLENRLADWERPRVRRYTAEDQEREYPGDLAFRFLPATTEKELVWPNRTFFERQG